MKTDRTDKEAERILHEFGPNNNVRFAAMADFARTLEKENARLLKQNAELFEQIKTLISPNNLGNSAFKKIVIKAYHEGRNDAKIESKPYVNPYEGKGWASEIVQSYRDGFNYGLTEWCGTT
jgi:hypothetical protein